MLVEGCDHTLRRSLGLNPGIHNYNLLCPPSLPGSTSSPPLTQAEQAADVRNFRVLVQAFTALHLEAEMLFIFEVLAAILHLGNILNQLHT